MGIKNIVIRQYNCKIYIYLKYYKLTDGVQLHIFLMLLAYWQFY